VKLKALAILLIVLGIGATIGGFYGQVFLNEDEGHHDGRVVTFALDSQSGADELVVIPAGANQIDVSIERAGQPISEFDTLHGSSGHVFVIANDFSHFEHHVSSEGLGRFAAPAGISRVVVQTAPSGGPDLLELGTTVEVDGESSTPQNITDTDQWSNGDLTVARQGFDFVLSETWNGEDVYGGPAFLTLFRAEDFAFAHAHAEVIDGNRFSFATNLPGLGEYFAALEFEQDSELVTALYRFTL
jgi:hypothetical protein